MVRGAKPKNPHELIDWSNIDWPLNTTCKCKCGTKYRSHCKFHRTYRLVSKDPCPSCGSHNNLCGASSDPEEMTL